MASVARGIRGEIDKDGISDLRPVSFVSQSGSQVPPKSGPCWRTELTELRSSKDFQRERGSLRLLSILWMAGQVRKPVQDVPTATRHVTPFTAF